MNMNQLPKLIQYTNTVFAANNINVRLLSNITYDQWKAEIDRVWGWQSDKTIHLLDGFYRLPDRIDTSATFYRT